jgi:Lrp/AsnC family leucine-responsive transcriptional regulator
MQLDSIDRRILSRLQQEGRLTNVELATQIGLSASPCLRRVKQLENSGVIAGYAARLDRRKLGLDILAFVEVQMERHSNIDAFREAVRAEPSVVSCFAMTGAFDFLLGVVTTSLDDFAAFTMQRLLRMPGVKDVRSSFVLEAVKDASALPLDHLAG